MTNVVPIDPARVPAFTLASASPRRSHLLREAGYAFRVVPSQVEEPDPIHFDSPMEYACHTAWRKANDVASRESGWVLAADTVVASGKHILGKPTDRDDAERILQMLQGTTHQVLTAICLWLPEPGVFLLNAETTVVRMRSIQTDELSDYLDSREWEGKAGAYGIQDRSDPFVEGIDGSYSNVVGLPMELLARMFNCASCLT